GPFGYKTLNVERQREDPDSLLNWMERAIRARKEWPELGWGEWEVLETEDDGVMAHVATWDGGSVLAVHNFSSRSARARAHLPESAREGRWRHVFGPRGGKPQIGDGKIDLELPPYGYHWFGRRAGV